MGLIHHYGEMTWETAKIKGAVRKRISKYTSLMEDFKKRIPREYEEEYILKYYKDISYEYWR